MALICDYACVISLYQMDVPISRWAVLGTSVEEDSTSENRFLFLAFSARKGALY